LDLNLKKEKFFAGKLMQMMWVSGGWLLLLLLATPPEASAGLLYPRDSPSRESKSLDGLWHFKTSPKVRYEYIG
jgi:hypothetical protein